MDGIIEALYQIEEWGAFCAEITMPSDVLKMGIKGFGPVEFPLKKSEMTTLIGLAKPAQFGWKDQTLTDPQVRNSWEIPANLIDLSDVAWEKAFNRTLDLLKYKLGLPENSKLTASLHNMLIYEQGQFFNTHQDSEKIDGMVASLVIILPSSHKGGELVINHHGDQKIIVASECDDTLKLAAFYADCPHEVKKVEKGYRLSLTYNLILENGENVEKEAEISAPEDLILSLHEYFFQGEAPQENPPHSKSYPQKLVYLLDHEYTEAGMSWNHLKNGDHQRAQALKAAAQLLNLDIHMALADIHESWTCTEDYDNYRSLRWRRDHDNDDDYELDELIDEDITLKNWIDVDNNPVSHAETSVSKDQLCWTKATDECDPFDSDYEGYMGNYGNTLDRWYHRAAIVLWAKQDHYAVASNH